MLFAGLLTEYVSSVPDFLDFGYAIYEVGPGGVFLDPLDRESQAWVLASDDYAGLLDLTGFKAAVYERFAYGEAIEAAGGVRTSLPYGELDAALRSGVLDGAISESRDQLAQIQAAQPELSLYSVSAGEDGIERPVLVAGPGRDPAETAERLVGTPVADLLSGEAGDDTLEGGEGADTLDGGAGVDTANWDGQAEDYILSLSTGTVTEKRDGTVDTLIDVELLQFSDGFEFGAPGAVDLRLIEGVRDVSAEDLTTFVEMYIAYFDRAPDALGLFYWGTRLAEGMGLEEIAASFFVQPESLATFPDVNDNAALVDAAYNNLLERAPDPQGRAYWIDALAQGTVSRPEFMLALINGAKAETGSAADAKVVEDKGRIGLDYAVINGLNDVKNAIDAMQFYDRADPEFSLLMAEGWIDRYRAAAESGGDEIIVELTGVIDDPFAA